MAYPTLRYKDKGTNVKVLQALLQSQGHFDGVVGGNFLDKTLSAVKYFQQTHVDEKGVFLTVDGVVGPKTWWALENSSGAPQRNFIDGRVPRGLPEDRVQLLQVALAEHNKKVVERPDGSNWGGEVSKYLEGIGPAPWCAFFVSWVWKEALGKYPLDKRHGHCLTFWRDANSKGFGHLRNGYSPIPGDAFIMLYRTKGGSLTGSGHTGFVLSVAPNGASFNTVEGNAGNRVKVGVRQKAEGTMHGFINLFGDAGLSGFDRKLLAAASTAGGSTR